MGLSTALNTALSGLKVTQAGLEVVSSNVANEKTPGYTRKNTVQTTLVSGGTSANVRLNDVQRTLDTYVQKQLRTESASLAYANITANYTDRLQKLFGTPGDTLSFTETVNGFVASLDSLSTSPENQSIRGEVLQDAQTLAQSLNSLTSNIQAMRQEADLGLQDTTAKINEALSSIERVSKQIASAQNPSVDLLDQRDTYIGQLSELMDIKVTPLENNQVAISTTSGLSLFSSGIASKLSFESRSAISAETLYSTNPAERTIGTVTLSTPGGITYDVLNPRTGVKSGTLKAYAELRDNTLVAAQAQLDELASVMTTALNTYTVDSTPVVGPPDGFEVDLGAVQRGDQFTFTYTEQPAGTERTITFLRVDDPSQLPLPNSATPNTNDTVFGIDFTNGMADVATQIATALGAGFTVTNPAGNSVQIVDDGGVTTTATGLSARVSATGFADNAGAIPLFVDGPGQGLYTNALEGTGQKNGYAGRIRVNSEVLASPEKLVIYDPATNQADSTRPQALRNALESTSLLYSTDTGIGSVNSPYSGSLRNYAASLVELQARNAEMAANVAEGQSIVVTSLQDRFADHSGVDVDDEMGRLIALQNAYAANARVISVVQEMFDVLSRM